MAASHWEPEEIQPDEVRQQLLRIVQSDVFGKKETLVRFLTYVVEATLAGKSEEIKQYSIGVDALGYRPGEESDATVRTHARRLRQALDAYYAGPGKTDSIRIELPKWQYVPLISRVDAASRKTALASTPLSFIKTPSHARRYAAGAVILCCGVVAGSYALRSKPTVADYNLRGLTFNDGNTHSPAPSRDGTLVAYSSDYGSDGGDDIWLKSMDAPDKEIKLTTHPADDIDPDLSPDTKWVVFRSMRDGGGVYVVSAAGGEARRLGPGFLPRFSPDGRRIAYCSIEESGNASIFVVPFEGGRPRNVSGGLLDAASPVWSSDGKRLLVRGAVRKSVDSREYDWWILAVDSTDPPVRTHAASALQTHVGVMGAGVYPSDWSPDNKVLLGFGRLIEVTLDGSGRAAEARLLYPGPSVSKPRYQNSGLKPAILFSLHNNFPRILGLRAELSRGKLTGERRHWTSDHSVNAVISLSQDGNKLAYSSTLYGHEHIVVKDLLNSRELQVTNGTGHHIRPVLNASGSRIAFFRRLSGTRSIGVVELSSGATQTVCDNCGELRDWSPDETRFLSVRGNSLLEIDARTRSMRTIVEDKSYSFQEAAYSPDAKWIAAVIGVSGKRMLQGIVLPSHGERSDWIPITEELYNLALHWSSDGKLLYFLSRRDDFRCLWAQRLHPLTKRPLGAVFPIEHFHSPQHRIINHGWVSVAGGWFAVSASRYTSNLFALEPPNR
jgi:Tol biopolymer transport system component